MSVHILIIEDEAKLAQFIQLELKYESYRVTVAKDGRKSRLNAARNLGVGTLSPLANYW